jgi:hypothetical protein
LVVVLGEDGLFELINSEAKSVVNPKVSENLKHLGDSHPFGSFE